MAKAKKSKSVKVKKVKKLSKPKKIKVSRAKVKSLPKSELKLYKALILKEREKVGGGLSHIAETTLNKSQREASGDLSGYAYHMADMASDDYERDFSLGRATDEQRILYSIDEAMKRIEDGSYGACLQCGKSIPKKRLKVLPYTEMCIECQKAKEHK